jgi:hypothetical protein
LLFIVNERLRLVAKSKTPPAATRSRRRPAADAALPSGGVPLRSVDAAQDA